MHVTEKEKVLTLQYRAKLTATWSTRRLLFLQYNLRSTSALMLASMLYHTAYTKGRMHKGLDFDSTLQILKDTGSAVCHLYASVAR